MKQQPIILMRGAHPSEVSARYIAKKVYDKLLAEGYETRLITVPFSRTMLSQVLKPTDCWEGEMPRYELLENFGFDSAECFYHDFHNYFLPEDFGPRRTNMKIIEDDCFLKIYPGDIMYDFNPDLDLGDDTSVMEGVTYEIPAFFKLLAPRILDKACGKPLTSSPREYDNIVVDFQKTKRYGFTGEFVVNLLADKIIEIHRLYPSPSHYQEPKGTR